MKFLTVIKKVDANGVEIKIVHDKRRDRYYVSLSGRMLDDYDTVEAALEEVKYWTEIMNEKGGSK